VAYNSILKPGGNFKVFNGISLAGVTVNLPAKGANLELDISAPIPCFHAGAGAGAGAAAAAGAGAVAAFGASFVLEQPCKPIADVAINTAATGKSLFINGCLI
jgi:hypothetical protein